MSAKTTKRVAASSAKKTNSIKKVAAKKSKTTKKLVTPVLMIYGAFAVSIVLFAAAGTIWYQKIYTNPKHIFWAMIENNLAQRGLAREVIQESQDGKSDEKTRIIFGVQPGVIITKEITQEASAGKSRIVVEGIGTSTDDYQKYSVIDRQITDGPKLDYSKLSNVWVHPNKGASGQANSEPQLLTQALLGTVVFGQLGVAERHQLTDFIRSHNAYKVDYDHAKRTTFEGHSVMSFPVAIKLEGLANSLQQYGKLSGLKAAQNITPSNFSGRPDLEVTMIVDMRTHQLLAVNYKNATATERFFNFGQAAEIVVPKRSVDQKTFENALNEIEKAATPATEPQPETVPAPTPQ